MTWRGKMELPRLFDIFSPLPVSGFLTSRKPWASTCSGTGRPAAMSIAGQMTQWKRMMSLPTMCCWAGQKRCRRSAALSESSP